VPEDFARSAENDTSRLQLTRNPSRYLWVSQGECSVRTVDSSTMLPRRPRVLVIDDEVANLRVFQRVFRNKFEVLVAETWPSAHELLAAATPPPDVVFVDMCMPRLDGIEVLALLRTAAPNIARFLLTGYGDTPEATAAIETGLCRAVLAKPWERAVVEAAVIDVVAAAR
jgi:putative two-component system response regulator